MKTEIRLNRFLAMAGIESRRKCDDIILSGKVKVNGEVVDRLGARVNPQTDVVEFEGKVIQPQQNLEYILLHKPVRTVTTVKDEHRRKTVLDIVQTDSRIFPVGRLDYMTSGAMLLTNDGRLAYFLTHPRFEVAKIYRVLLDRVVRPIDLHRLQTGVMLEGRMTAPCKAREMRVIDNGSLLEIELHEGRNRQIRKMMDILGYKVEELQRVSFAGLEVKGLKPGEWRFLTNREIQNLQDLVDRQAQTLNVEHP